MRVELGTNINRNLLGTQYPSASQALSDDLSPVRLRKCSGTIAEIN
jgi:hypothetical protein